MRQAGRDTRSRREAEIQRETTSNKNGIASPVSRYTTKSISTPQPDGEQHPSEVAETGDYEI